MAYDFAPDSQLISFADHANYDFTSDFALGVWVNFDTLDFTTNAPTLVKKNGNYLLRAEGTVGVGAINKLQLLWWDGTDIKFVAVGSNPSTGGFHHILAQVTTNAVTAIYVDGVDATGSTGTAVPIVARDLTAVLTLGNGSGAPDFEGMDGKLAAVALWSSVISAGDRTSLAAGLSPLMVSPSTLKAYMPLRENAVDIITGQTGTVTGASLTTHPTIIEPPAHHYRRLMAA